MAAYEYTYARKTVGGELAIPAHGDPSLISNIEAAFPAPRMWRVAANGTDVVMSFEVELDTQEQIILGDCYAAWIPESEAEPAALRISELVASRFPPDHRELNYKSGLNGSLHKRITNMFRGEVREVSYWKDYTEAELVLLVEVAYVRDENGMAQYRTTTRTWYREDSTAHPDAKATMKVYDAFHSMEEGKRRRNNVVNMLKLTVLGMLMATEQCTQAEAEALGIPYFGKYTQDIDDYVEVSYLGFKTPPASPNVTDDTEYWLDNIVDQYGTTIRDVILESFKTIMEA